MAFDSTTRGKLQRLVTACRNLLTDEFDDQLQSVYGIYAEEARVLELDKLTSLDDDQHVTGSLLRERIAHLRSGLAGSKTPLKDSVQRVLREQAFTVLNRFAALRMAEARELVLQCVGGGLNSKGFQVFENVASPDLGNQYERYCVFLGCLLDELSLDLGVLFDRYSPFGLLFPREPKLKEFLLLLNDPELVSLWREDETIGWIYQYFNDPAERKQMREAAAPRNSRELAVRNQFFTPRYVVEFLIDNTLGRLWYEMTKGRTELARRCRYLLRRPNEVFLGNPNVISSLDAAAAWVREVILTADFSRLPEDPTVGELSDFGLAIDGYAEMERRGRSWDDFIATFYYPQAEAAEKTGEPWKGDVFELWCALFAYQRGVLSNGYFSDTDRASVDETLRHLWPGLRRALQNPSADLSQEEMLRLPQFIPHRPIKDPREIRLLDPACGSMHFGLYAFDLFELIYAEAHQAHAEVGTEALRDASGPGVLDAVSADAVAFSREVPRLIIECNIHGIDIDPRAVQIAGLSLWLRAQRAWHQAGMKPADRPRITRSNLVCTEPMPGEKELLRQFVEQQFPAGERPAFAFLLEKVFDHMTLAGEAGSLLRIDEEIRAAIAEARALAQSHSAPQQARLFPDDERPGQAEFNLRGLNEQQFWKAAEQRIYEALEAYAEKAENGGGFQRRLFADDAAQGFAFIDLCRKRYDVVVMNPPFGDPPERANTRLQRDYLAVKHDLASAFLERGHQLLRNSGLLGCISTRTLFFLSYLGEWREQFFLRQCRLHCFCDLGVGVLDAMVETAMYTFANEADKATAATFLKASDVDDRALLLEELTRYSLRIQPNERVFLCDPRTFGNIPRSPFAYWVPDKIRNLFSELPAFETTQRHGHIGALSQDDFRFVRIWWEVSPKLIAAHWTSGTTLQWVPYTKGGTFAPYYMDIPALLSWKDDGEELKAFLISYRKTKGFADQWTGQLNAYDLYFSEGITWSSRPLGQGSFWVLPKGCIFRHSAPAILDIDTDALCFDLAVINSVPFRFLLDLLMPRGSTGTATLKYELGYVRSVPVPRVTTPEYDALTGFAREATRLLMGAYRSFEGAHLFVCPQMQPALSLHEMLRVWSENAADAQHLLAQASAQIDALARRFYRMEDDSCKDLLRVSNVKPVSELVTSYEMWRECSPASAIHSITSYALGGVFGRWDIRYVTGERPTPELPDPFAPLPVCPPGMFQGDDGLPLSPEAGRRLRAEGRYPLDVAWDGILVDDPEHPLDLEARVHAALAVLWGDRTDALEHEACALLGVPTLRDWFRRPPGFFADHLKRYSKSRRQAPIYWPLSTASGSYTLWLYYDRLNAQTLYTCVTDFVKPKLDSVTADADRLQSRTQTGATAKERNELQELRDFQAEIQELHDELLRVAQLPWKPNLNDGVLITASPLWKLFRLPKWQKDLKACWEEFAAGDYDWAHLALTIWPDRVRAKCKTDRSLAIAHGLEDLCEVEAPKPKTKPGRKDQKREKLI